MSDTDKTSITVRQARSLILALEETIQRELREFSANTQMRIEDVNFRAYHALDATGKRAANEYAISITVAL